MKKLLIRDKYKNILIESLRFIVKITLLNNLLTLADRQPE